MDVTAAQARVQLAAENVAAVEARRGARGRSRPPPATSASSRPTRPRPRRCSPSRMPLARHSTLALRATACTSCCRWAISVAPSALQPAADRSPPAPCGDLPALERTRSPRVPTCARRSSRSKPPAAGSDGSARASCRSSLSSTRTARGTEGFELGPGLETDFGLIDRNQPGRASRRGGPRSREGALPGGAAADPPRAPRRARHSSGPGGRRPMPGATTFARGSSARRNRRSGPTRKGNCRISSSSSPRGA